jgi:hypothetical protein
MKIIKLKAVPATSKILSLLERRNLIRTLKPTKAVLNCKSKRGTLETIYSTSLKFGSHKLICIKPNLAKIKLNSHPDNEDFIIINNTTHKFRPLYIVVGLNKHRFLEEKAKNGNLIKDDFIFLRLKYNDPKTCIFTMLKDTPHCELTLRENGPTPVFFVAEPSRLKMRILKLNGYKFVAIPSSDGRKVIRDL